ncbi:hypothetical protein JANAI62_09990 [Jannaschia pagri]|uniref:Uncharacterized protein n=1 Tax=Jannaschia pagri TaxID=2829797 RepID=A0ABQ4NIX5_9RHOB|nr:MULTISPECIES: DUF6497 family protein [unclassified Jannaschia]GIT90544.1 hypothetical protein JANAI61_10020 [Jannaschia sp. AI_61]GIT94376.1 hypothetical protein JANAI62_09990 [Jannaschia sp. AI_62]
MTTSVIANWSRGSARRVAALALAAGLTAAPAAADGVPSGQPIVLWQVLWERVEGQGTQAILRFIAPGVARDGGAIDYDTARTDMDWLCDTHGLPVAGLDYARSDSIVITLMDRAVARGTTDPAATQYFAVYEVENGSCVAEDF